ncbi:MAG: hypothetical protein P4K98_13300, partial [Bryobacteraceae bacterium]|nr:hypothetical protein [Bryobacteraceae bacterium]
MHGLESANRDEPCAKSRAKSFLHLNRNVYNPQMRGIPWSTIALGSLLLIPACANEGGQEVQSPQPEKSQPP